MGAGMLDYHTLVALESGWQTDIGATADAFKAIFNGVTTPAIPPFPDSILQTWYDKLVPDGDVEYVGFGLGNVFGVQRIPWVGVTLNDQPSDIIPLGFYSGRDADLEQDVLGLLYEQTVSIHVYGPMQLVRALNECVRAIMITCGRTWFPEVGYDGLVYAGGGDLEPEPELLDEWAGSFHRVQRWTARVQTEVARQPIAHKPTFVHANDIVVGGNQGGADPNP